MKNHFYWRLVNKSKSRWVKFAIRSCKLTLKLKLFSGWWIQPRLICFFNMNNFYFKPKSKILQIDPKKDFYPFFTSRTQKKFSSNFKWHKNFIFHRNVLPSKRLILNPVNFIHHFSFCYLKFFTMHTPGKFLARKEIPSDIYQKDNETISRRIMERKIFVYISAPLMTWIINNVLVRLRLFIDLFELYFVRHKRCSRFFFFFHFPWKASNKAIICSRVQLSWSLPILPQFQLFIHVREEHKNIFR